METNGKPAVEHSSPSADEKVQDALSEHNISPAEFTDKSYDPETLEIDHVAEKKLVRKLDLYIVPPVMLLYLFSFLDRVNIGNARLYGLETDLDMTGNKYQTAVSLLFVTYICCEIPSNLVLKKLHPSRWIAFITVSWGLIATLSGLCHSYASFIVCRLLLGAVEAGLFPGMTIYLTFFYTKRELALRVGYLFVSAALAGGVGGLLAYGIGSLDHHDGLRGWRWIMIIEGLPTLVLGVATWWWLADDPETAYYLTPEEKALMMVRKERQIGFSRSGDHFHKEDMIAAFKDWRCWAFSCGQFGADTVLYGYSTFLPTIIKGLGKWTTAQTNALTVPCYAVGAISYLLIARLSDSQQRRGLYSCIFPTISVIGYAILISDASAGVHYFGCFVVAMGLYVTVGIPLAWLPTNIPRYGKRVTASGMQLTIGNAAGVMAPYLFPTAEGPRYIKGHAVSMALAAMSAIIYGLMTLYYIKQNRDRKGGKQDGIMAGKNEEEIAELGDANPRFIYTI